MEDSFSRLHLRNIGNVVMDETCSMSKKGRRAQSRTLSLSQGKESSICAVCCQAVTPGKDEALLCKGILVRNCFCASITEEQYQELTAGAWRVTSKGTVLTSSQKFVGGNQMAWWPEIKREKVPLKSTTPGAILSALKKLTTVGKQVTIKHKYRKMDSGHTRWWFVLRGGEEVLTQLEGELEHVRLQLQWNTQITSYHDLPRPSSIIQNTVTIWLEQQIH